MNIVNRYAVLAACALLALSACGPSTLRIGFAADLSGKNSQLGIDGRNAALLAVEQINARGGLAGHPLELLVVDDTNNLDTAIERDLSLVQQGCPLIIGHYLSSMVPAIERVMAEKEVLFLSPTIALSSLSGKDDFFVRSYPSANVQARVIAREMLGAGRHQVVMVHDTSNALYAESVNKTAGDTLQAGGATLLADLPFTSAEGAYQALASAILSYKPDAVLMSLSGFDAAQLAQQLRKANDKIAFYGPNWPQTADLIEQGGRAVEGMTVLSLYENDPPSAAHQAFTQAYQEHYGSKPGFASYLSYELFMILEEALASHAGALDAPAIKAAILAKGQFSGLQSALSIDRYGDATKSYRIMRIQDGAYLEVGRL